MLESKQGQGRSLLRFGKPSAIRLNIMVVGETGSGKTTFLKTLFKVYCGNKIIRAELCSKTIKTVKIEEIGFFTLETAALDCEVHLFDSPGYGDYINNQDAIETVKGHLEQAHNAWLVSNGNPMTEKARNAADSRIHCVFYFIAPHRIKDIDKEFIKQLTGLAPLVMVVAKADTMTWQERKDHLIAVLKLVDELQAACKMPIAFDFHEEDVGFMDHYLPEKSPRTPSNVAAQADLSFSYNDFLDLSSSFVEESESRPLSPLNLSACSYQNSSATPHFSFRGQAYQPDNGEQAMHVPLAVEVAKTAESPQTAATFSTKPQPPSSVHVPLPKIRNAFAVVCDTSESGKREYPWGSLDIYDEEHSDFRRLQRLVFESDHIVRLRELTQEMSMALNKPKTLERKRVFRGIKPLYEGLGRVTAVCMRVVNTVFLTAGWLVLPMFVCMYFYHGSENFTVVFRSFLASFLEKGI